jgi:abnormal spindle-like microcephaly-associated protein
VRSASVSDVLTKIEKEVKEGRLCMRADRECSADVGVRDTLLQKLLSFNIFWLRPAVEVLFSEAVPRSHSADSVNLFRFLAAHLVKCPDIASKHGISASTSELSTKPAYYKDMNQHVLQKFLSLILILDHCKTGHVLDSDPCLFTTVDQVLTPYGLMSIPKFKTTRDLLAGFSAEFLSGEGDVFKHLSSLGYTLSHQQAAIDEYDLLASNLGVDMRDGVRLARLAEVITHKTNLLAPKLRVPAISRLQKVSTRMRHLTEVTDMHVRMYAETRSLEPCDLCERLLCDFKPSSYDMMSATRIYQ